MGSVFYCASLVDVDVDVDVYLLILERCRQVVVLVHCDGSGGVF